MGTGLGAAILTTLVLVLAVAVVPVAGAGAGKFSMLTLADVLAVASVSVDWTIHLILYCIPLTKLLNIKSTLEVVRSKLL